MVPDPGPNLVEAAPFIEAFRDEVVVVKIGGELLDEGPSLERILPQVAVLYRCGVRPVVVHGGGRQVDEECARRGIVTRKVGGRRVTTPEVMAVVAKVVAGDLNRRIVAGLGAAGVPARGHADGVGGAVRCRRRPPTVAADGSVVEWGEVGDVEGVEVGALLSVAGLEGGSGRGGAGSDRWVVPVLASVGVASDGALLNVNADTVASRVAVPLRAIKLVLLTAVPGVLDLTAPAPAPISELTPEGVRRLMASGAVGGGMRPKLEEALAALEGGVPRVHIISGLDPHTLIREIFTVEGCGTLICAGPGGGASGGGPGTG